MNIFVSPLVFQYNSPGQPLIGCFSVFSGNRAVHEHAEPQPRASRRLRACHKVLLWLQGLQQGRWQQQGHTACGQAEVVPLTAP